MQTRVKIYRLLIVGVPEELQKTVVETPKMAHFDLLSSAAPKYTDGPAELEEKMLHLRALKPESRNAISTHLQEGQGNRC